MPNPDLLIDNNPDATVESPVDFSAIPVGEQEMDLRVAHAHSAPTVEFITLFVDKNKSFNALDYDASRIRVTLWTGTDATQQTVLVSSQDVSGIVADVSVATPGATFTAPRTGPYVNLTQLVLAGGAPLILDTQSEIWLYGVPSAGGAVPAQVSVLVERYASA